MGTKIMIFFSSQLINLRNFLVLCFFAVSFGLFTLKIAMIKPFQIGQD